MWNGWKMKIPTPNQDRDSLILDYIEQLTQSLWDETSLDYIALLHISRFIWALTDGTLKKLAEASTSNSTTPITQKIFKSETHDQKTVRSTIQFLRSAYSKVDKLTPNDVPGIYEHALLAATFRPFSKI
ncbi:MAG: hypothetical protein EZS28_001157 [Streblomastix strix]|uniref:Uncharacterized protein n=1 Tax=Streblomastix strix TaxID=222440 RepID=A0A5J4X9Q8_9EUKA|nr:MAG: hypothetical protein EZS28_001157 [Streblomastix strix]